MGRYRKVRMNVLMIMILIGISATVIYATAGAWDAEQLDISSNDTKPNLTIKNNSDDTNSIFTIKDNSNDIDSDFIIEDTTLKKYLGTDKNVIIPEGITSIQERALENNESIETVIFPSDVAEIGSRAFYACRNLKYITLNMVLCFVLH